MLLGLIIGSLGGLLLASVAVIKFKRPTVHIKPGAVIDGLNFVGVDVHISGGTVRNTSFRSTHEPPPVNVVVEEPARPLVPQEVVPAVARPESLAGAPSRTTSSPVSDKDPEKLLEDLE